jgi:hypothetical protein
MQFLTGLCYTLGALALAGFCATFAKAEPEGLTVTQRETFDPRPPIAFYAKATELAKWIDEHSDYGAMQRHPAYVFLPQQTIQYMFYEATDHGYTGSEEGTVFALYHDSGTIFLRDDFDLETDTAHLVHELVHHLQQEEKREYSCHQEREADAYRLQHAYVDASGIGEKVDALWVHFVTHCGDYY